MGEYVRGEGKKFMHVSSGKLKESTGKKDEDGATIYKLLDGYEGKLVSIEKFQDEFEGKMQSKIRINMKDDKSDEIADITFTDETFFVLAFFSRLIEIDLDYPFLLGILPSEQNSKMSFCFMKQFGKKIEKNKEFPQPEKIDLGNGKFAYKWAKVTPEIDRIISEINGYLAVQNTEIPPDATE